MRLHAKRDILRKCGKQLAHYLCATQDLLQQHAAQISQAAGYQDRLATHLVPGGPAHVRNGCKAHCNSSVLAERCWLEGGLRYEVR